MLTKTGRDVLFSLATLLGTATFVQVLYSAFGGPGRLENFEQEAVIILAVWAFFLLAHQARQITRHRRLLGKNYVQVEGDRLVLPEQVRLHRKPIEALSPQERGMFLPRTLMRALNRFGTSRSAQDASEAVREECEVELFRLDAQLMMIRFAAWAIPAIGFLGVVRGMGAAVQHSDRAGDMNTLSMGFGLTFNSTFTAMILCVAVLFLLQQVQQAQDRLVLDTRTYIDRSLIRYMRMW